MPPKLATILSRYALSVPATLLIGMPGLVYGQVPANNDPSVALTSFGAPDLGGVWVYRSATPLQRPEELRNKPLLSDAEVDELRARAQRLFADPNTDAPPGDQLYLAVLANPDRYRNLNSTQTIGSDPSVTARDFENRTSLIVDPPGGRIPEMTVEGRQRQATNASRSFNLSTRPGGDLTAEDIASANNRLPLPAGPRDLASSTRCITWGVPRLGGTAFFTSHFQIVQAKDHVAILQEVNHETRLISLDGRPSLSPRIRQWNGDSRGRWEGGTLVVETANFSADSHFFGSNENLHLVERFTRTSPDTLEYEVTITDPTTWVQPWTAMVQLRRTNQPIYEFACHEGNLETMRGILAAARARQSERSDARTR